MLYWSFKVRNNLKLKNILIMKLLHKQRDYRLITSSSICIQNIILNEMKKFIFVKKKKKIEFTWFLKTCVLRTQANIFHKRVVLL